MNRTEWGCRSLRPFNKNRNLKCASATRRKEISNVVNNEMVSVSTKSCQMLPSTLLSKELDGGVHQADLVPTRSRIFPATAVG